MKQRHAFLYLLLLCIGLTGCMEDEKNTPTIPSPIEISLSTPGGVVSLSGIKSGISFYLSENTLADVTVQQGSLSIPLKGLPLTDIPADGSTAKVTLSGESLKGLNTDKPYSVRAVVKGSSKETAAIISKAEENVPYDILAHMGASLSGETGEAKGTRVEVSLTLSEEQLLALRVGNTSKETIAIHNIVLSDLPETKATRANVPSKEVILTLSDRSTVSPKEQVKVLGVLPRRIKGMVTLSINGITADQQVEISDTGEELLSAVFTAKDALNTSTAKDLLPTEKANTIGGGDPYFSMSDITFWVGEGSKRSAFVLDFHLDKQEEALVWGYKYDGDDKSTWSMIQAIAEKDPRFCVLMGQAQWGLAIGGFGYLTGDLKDRKAQVIAEGATFKETSPGVFATSDLKYFDTAKLSDDQSLWCNGWGFSSPGYWSFFTRMNRLSPFSYSGVGPGIDRLTDGSWSAMSFQHGWDSMGGVDPGKKFIAAPTE